MLISEPILSLINISETTRRRGSSYSVFCLTKKKNKTKTQKQKQQKTNKKNTTNTKKIESIQGRKLHKPHKQNQKQRNTITQQCIS